LGGLAAHILQVFGPRMLSQTFVRPLLSAGTAEFDRPIST